MNKELNLSDASNDKIEALFKRAFEELIEDRNNDLELHSSNIDVSVDEKSLNGKVTVRVDIYGMAGETTRDKFHNRENGSVIDGCETIIVEDEVGRSATFKLKDSMQLDPNKFAVFYQGS